MRNFTITILAVIFGLAASGSTADSSARVYGKITTTDGDVLEGLIRWDKNEACWVDILNGNKDLESKNRHRSTDERRKKVKIFGLQIGETYEFGNSAESGMRVGHIRSIIPEDDDVARIILKSGKEVELSGGSTDIGEDIRELIIEDKSEGEVELSWDELERVDFMDTPRDLNSTFGDRLYGTLTTRRGDEFTGFVCWDVDEVFTTDVLDGEDGGKTRKIKFGKIASIERYSSSGATVKLTAGDEFVLRGTNDVDQSNSGIIISDPSFGQVTIQWDEFEKLVFKPLPTSLPGYSFFDGGRQLAGTVTTEEGDTYTGDILWDSDEEFTWEVLNGDSRGIEFDIELGSVKSIEKASGRSSEVTLQDGRVYRLRGSNDVDEDNKGIRITQKNGDDVWVDWDEFAKVEFSK